MEDLLNVGGGSGTVTEESKPNMVNEPESVQEPFSTSSDDNN